LVYYNAPARSVEEFEYFIDSLSRYQLLESGERIVIRVVSDAPDDMKSLFHTAKKRYVKAWSFDPVREQILEKIKIERVTAVTSTYNPGRHGVEGMKKRAYGPSLYYATDKNIFDALNQHKVDAATVAKLFHRRNIVVSKKTLREDLAQYFSRLTHDYCNFSITWGERRHPRYCDTMAESGRRPRDSDTFRR
jgi:hypothetical protein